MIDVSTDHEGHSLRHLVWRALKGYQTTALFQFLEDRDVIVRSAAARELQVRGGRRVFKRAEQLLGSKSKSAREIAAFLLGQLGGLKRPYKKESTKLLLELLKSERNPLVRATAITSLGQLKAVKALERIITYADDRSPSVRGGVAFAIGMAYSGGPKKIPLRLERVMRKLHSDKSRTVREFATLAFELAQGPRNR